MAPSSSRTFKLTMNGTAVQPPSWQPHTGSIKDKLKYCHIVKQLKGELLMSTEPQS